MLYHLRTPGLSLL